MNNTATRATAIEMNNLEKSCMGTIVFDGKFEGMRKAQEFDVYPIAAGQTAGALKATIQSDTRMGEIDLTSGQVVLTKSIASGAFSHHMALAKSAGKLSAEQLATFKSKIFETACRDAGTNGLVYADNSGAASVLGGAQ